jgi:TfoX/Sxy family transcriptional regulator of competence genes
MPWKKSSESLVSVFDRVLAGFDVAERRQMFGYPCAFVGGNLCFGLFEEQFMVRLDAENRASALALAGAAPFEPMAGRPMREYVVLPSSVVAKPRELERWVARSVAYVGSLPPKTPKHKAAKRP